MKYCNTLLTKNLRAAYRFIAFCVLAVIQTVKYTLVCLLIPKLDRIHYQASWLHQSCRYLVSLFGIELRCDGMSPSKGVLVCNHLSYLDIIALAANGPLVFVAKKEVRRWPGIGWLAMCGGTIFVDRDNKQNAPCVVKEIENIISRGAAVCLFPEGTSTDGTSVLPFKSPLLAPAVTLNQEVTPARISYALVDDCATKEICYHGTMSFLPHFFKLLSHKKIETLIVYSKPVTSSSRKILATLTRNIINGLAHYVNKQHMEIITLTESDMIDKLLMQE